MRPSTRRQLTFAAALLAGLLVLGAGALYVAYLRIPVVHEVVDHLFPRHRGELVATVGIPLEEMRRRSSAPISPGFTYAGTTHGVFEPFFDWQLLGTSIRFRGCRYGSYSTDKSGVIGTLTVFPSPRRLRWSEMVEELRATGEQLKAAGFRADVEGHSIPDDVLLAEWLVRKAPAGDVLSTDPFIWLRGDLKFAFYGEQQTTDGWVQHIELVRISTAP